MFKPGTWPPASWGERPLPQTVRGFLVESERRVLLHCQRLLAQQKLAGDERQRLLDLAIAAEQEIQRLAGLPECMKPRRIEIGAVTASSPQVERTAA